MAASASSPSPPPRSRSRSDHPACNAPRRRRDLAHLPRRGRRRRHLHVPARHAARSGRRLLPRSRHLVMGDRRRRPRHRNVQTDSESRAVWARMSPTRRSWSSHRRTGKASDARWPSIASTRRARTATKPCSSTSSSAPTPPPWRYGRNSASRSSARCRRRFDTAPRGCGRLCHAQVSGAALIVISWLTARERWLPAVASLAWWTIFHPGFISEDSIINLSEARAGTISVVFTAWWVYVVDALSLGYAQRAVADAHQRLDARVRSDLWIITVFPQGRSRAITVLLIAVSPLVAALGIQVRHDGAMACRVVRVRDRVDTNLARQFAFQRDRRDGVRLGCAAGGDTSKRRADAAVNRSTCCWYCANGAMPPRSQR